MSTPPTAELHVHVEGTLEPELIVALAARNGIALPYADLADLRSRYEFADLQSFLDLYYANMQVLQTAEDFAELTRAYLRRAAAGGVRHVELFFDPQAHLTRGVALATVVDGLAAAVAGSEPEFGISAALIACFLRDRPEAEALGVLEDLLALAPDRRAPVIGIGLDSAERDHPPADFVRLFARAAEAGLHRVAHAGEEGPADYVRQALDLLGVERIDHGIRCLEDPALVARLVAEQVPLTVCPLSNVRLRAVPTLAEHPLRTLLDAGVLVSVHSDDPAYFGGYVEDNYRQTAQALGLSGEQLATLARNAVRSSFADPARQAALLAEVDAWSADRAGK